MWIKWKYNDHGWPDFAELEIPDDLDGYETVEEYLCEKRELCIPTWSERFLSGRVYWQKLDLSPEELKSRTVERLKATIEYHKNCIKRAQEKLDNI
jgi:hypothetical protein